LPNLGSGRSWGFILFFYYLAVGTAAAVIDDLTPDESRLLEPYLFLD
jgi:hypothetical protein